MFWVPVRPSCAASIRFLHNPFMCFLREWIFAIFMILLFCLENPRSFLYLWNLSKERNKGGIILPFFCSLPMPSKNQTISISLKQVVMPSQLGFEMDENVVSRLIILAYNTPVCQGPICSWAGLRLGVLETCSFPCPPCGVLLHPFGYKESPFLPSRQACLLPQSSQRMMYHL